MYEYKKPNSQLPIEQTPIDVYWCARDDHSEFIGANTSHIYKMPKSLFEESMKLAEKYPPGSSTFLRCPATSDLMKRTFVFRAPTDKNLFIDNSQDEPIVLNEESPLYQPGASIVHSPTLVNNQLVYVDLSFLMFSSESLVMALTPPWFGQSACSQFGAIVPGQFDIGKWFRAINIEFNLWEGINQMQFPADDPLAYITLHTERPIRLHQFYLSNRLREIAKGLTMVKTVPLFSKMSDRYKQFEEAKLRKAILSEIQNNLLED